MPGMEKTCVCVCVCFSVNVVLSKISSREKVQIPDSENFMNLGRSSSAQLERKVEHSYCLICWEPLLTTNGLEHK